MGLETIGNVIAIASGKGGVGKSTLTVNLAAALRAQGLSVGVLDADIYGPSQPRMLGAEGTQASAEGQSLMPITRHGIRFMSLGLLMPHDGPVVWRAPMAMKVLHQFLANVSWGDLDVLLIDLPPGTGDVQLTLAQQASLAGAVIVTTPQEVAIGVARKGLRMFQQVNVPILGVIENMSGFTCEFCGRATQIFKEGGAARMADELGIEFLGAVPLDRDIMSCGDDGVPVPTAKPDSPGARAFAALARAMMLRLTLARGETSVPEPDEVTLTSTGELQIRWPGGHAGMVRPWTLRTSCACAACVDERTGKKILDPSRVPPGVQIQAFAPVGRYALSIRFSDGHDTGIFAYERLRRLCECPSCLEEKVRRGSAVSPGPASARDTAAESMPRSAADSVGRLAEPETATSGSNRRAEPVPVSDPIAARRAIEEVLDREINPAVASHGGKVELVSLEGARVGLRMSGGCQGCSSAAATMRQGVEQAIRRRVSGIEELVDVTDHAAGEKPYLRT